MRARPVLPVLLLAVAALAGVGCGSEGSDGTPTTTAVTPAAEASTTTVDPATTTSATETTTATTAATLPTAPTAPVDDTSPAATRLQLRPVIGSEPCSSVRPDDPDATATTTPDPATPELVPDAAGETCYGLGPIAATGADLTDAVATSADEDSWLVTVTPAPGSVDRLNALFDACNGGADTCPADLGSGQPGRVAIVLDGVVRSAPSVPAPDLAREPFQISGLFTEDEARDLAELLTA